MKKYLLLAIVAVVTINLIANDVIGVGTAWVPEGTAAWSVSAANELQYDGANRPIASPAVIATNFQGLTSGANWSYYAGLTLTFDAYMTGNATDTMSIVLGAKDVWTSKKGFIVQISKNNVKIVPNGFVFSAATTLSTDETAYQAAVKPNAYNAIKIQTDADANIYVTVNGYECPGVFMGSNQGTTPMNTYSPANRPALFGTSYAGFKLKNLVASRLACTPITGAAVNGVFPTISLDAATKSYFTVASGINQPKQSEISVYPNPVTSKLIIANEQSGQQFSIKNLLGQQVKTGIITSDQHVLDFSDLKTGNYMLVIQTDKGVKSTSVIKK